jgi:hypothetical protein
MNNKLNINIMITKQNFDCDYGYGYIELINRGYERNTNYEIVVEGTYDDYDEDQVIDYIEFESGLI